MEEKLSLKEKLDKLRAAQGSGPRKSSDVLVDRPVDGSPPQAAPPGGAMPPGPAAPDDPLPGMPGLDAEDIEAAALERELLQAEEEAAEELDTGWQPPKSGGGRDVELEAELQALRQEVDLLRNAARDKDNALEELGSQCRSLEDALEDRDRDLDRLYQELEQARSGLPSALGEKSGLFTRSGTVGGAARRNGGAQPFEERDTTDVLDGTSLIFTPPGKKSTVPTWVVAGLVGLLVGFILVAGVLFFISDRQSAAPRVAGQSSPATTAGQVPAAESEPSPSRSEAQPPITAGQPAPPPPRPTAPKDLRDSLRNGSQGPAMVLLPGGSYTMGDKRGLAAADEQPAHRVQVQPFYIGRTEVTFEDYDRFARATGRALPNDSGWGRGRQPVINVSWDDARAYADWLSRQSGERYRLPSEAEWEYAARGGSTSRYWWGFKPGEGRAVCFDCGSEWDNRQPAPVASLMANPYGLYDTAGNLMEWVQDCVNANYQGAPEDGGAWLSGDCSRRMIRSGAFNKPARSMRSSDRFHLPRDSRLNNLGFRLVREM